MALRLEMLFSRSDADHSGWRHIKLLLDLLSVATTTMSIVVALDNTSTMMMRMSMQTTSAMNVICMDNASHIVSTTTTMPPTIVIKR